MAQPSESTAQQLVRGDRKVADPDAGRVADRVGDGGRVAHDADPANALGAHRVDVRVGPAGGRGASVRMVPVFPR